MLGPEGAVGESNWMKTMSFHICHKEIIDILVRKKEKEKTTENEEGSFHPPECDPTPTTHPYKYMTGSNLSSAVSF